MRVIPLSTRHLGNPSKHHCSHRPLTQPMPSSPAFLYKDNLLCPQPTSSLNPIPVRKPTKLQSRCYIEITREVRYVFRQKKRKEKKKKNESATAGLLTEIDKERYEKGYQTILVPLPREHLCHARHQNARAGIHTLCAQARDVQDLEGRTKKKG